MTMLLFIITEER